MADDSTERVNGKFWMKLVSILASGGILAAIISFALPRIWPKNKPPTAVITINEMEGKAPLKILADGLQSSDPEGKKLTFEWAIDEIIVSSEPSFTRTIESPGLYTIVLTVMDHDGLKSMDSKIIKVLKQEPTLILHVFSDQKSSRSGSLEYVMSSDEGKIFIKPNDRYLNDVYGGEIIKPLSFIYSPWEWSFSFPTLDITILNDTKEKIVLHESIFRVKRSWLDQRPLPIIDGTGYHMRLPLRNIGWGPMHGTMIRFALVDSGESTEGIVKYPYTINAKTIETTLENDSLASYFEEAGVDMTLLDKLQQSIGGSSNWIYFSKESSLGKPYTSDDFGGEIRRMPRSEYQQLRKEAYGRFSSGVAVVIGELQYGSIEKSGEMQEKVNKFIAKVSIGGPGVGQPLRPSNEYDVKLKVSGSDYEVPVPIYYAIDPEGTDRFLLRIAADKSSFHEFDVSFHFNNQVEISTDPIELELFLSRNDARLMASKRQDEVIRPPKPSSGRQH